MTNQMVDERADEAMINLSQATLVPVNPSDVAPLNHEAALASYSEAERKEILDLSASIDVRQIDKVMQYGEIALRRTFEQCGDFLKDERGSLADQEVIAEVIKLSKKASDSYDDFNLVIKEPNLFQKIFLKLSAKGKRAHTQKIQNSAATNYKLLLELQSSCEAWLDMLKNAMGQISDSAFSDLEAATLLEKYIIAGKIAEERIGKELVTLEDQYRQTGLQTYSQDYEEMKEGFDIFALKMANLEKSRVMYHLSLGQLSLIKRSNRNVQISIHTQKANSMALMGQQLRNAVLNAKNREVLEGQKAISRLNDELIQAVSQNVGLTAQESEKLMYAGFYNIDAAKAAVTAVIDSCKAIEKVASEMLPKMKAETEQLNALVSELEPFVDPINNEENNGANTTVSTTSSNGNLNF